VSYKYRNLPFYEQNYAVVLFGDDDGDAISEHDARVRTTSAVNSANILASHRADLLDLLAGAS